MNDADDRFASIAGGGLKRRRPPISVVPAPSEVANEAERPAVGERKRQPPRTGGQAEPATPTTGERGRPKSADVGGTRRAAFRVPEDIDAKLRARVRDEGSSKIHVMLDAIEHVVATETKLDFDSHKPAPVKSALFTRPRTATAATPTVQAEISMDAASLGTIDKLADKYGAPTRTAFLLACLGEYLQ